MFKMVFLKVLQCSRRSIHSNSPGGEKMLFQRFQKFPCSTTQIQQSRVFETVRHQQGKCNGQTRSGPPVDVCLAVKTEKMARRQQIAALVGLCSLLDDTRHVVGELAWVGGVREHRLHPFDGQSYPPQKPSGFKNGPCNGWTTEVHQLKTICSAICLQEESSLHRK